LEKRKLAVIGGASGDIGSAIAKKLGQEGYDLFLHYYNNQDALLRLEEDFKDSSIECMTYRADLSKADEVQSMADRVFQAFPQHEIYLVNCQGRASFQLCQLMSNTEWDEIMAINLNSFFYMTRAFLKGFLAQKSGAIVNISSMWGISGSCMESAYSAAKGGVIAFTKAMAKELGPSGIRVNCVAPGLIQSKMNDQLTAEDLAQLEDHTALERMGKPQEVANLVHFLLSDQSSYMTGQCVVMDGGFLLQ
jgi:3-oxoacyl-[acyl-carrier protein] reductase